MVMNPILMARISKLAARIAPDYFSSKLANPFFILGSARSGTWLLARTLAFHKDIATYPSEANELWHPQTYPWRHSPHNITLPPLSVSPKEFTERSLKYRSAFQIRLIRSTFGAYQSLAKKTYFLNKSAMITFMIPFILNEFPEAKFIHVVRDGRGVALSGAKKTQGKILADRDLYQEGGFDMSFEDSLRAFAKSWELHIEEVDRQIKALDLMQRGVIHEIKYENFCSNPKEHLCQIAQFMGIDPDEFVKRDYPDIVSKNYKYNQELDANIMQELARIMELSLRAKGYL